MKKIIALKNTIAKLKPNDSKKLNKDEKINVYENQEFEYLKTTICYSNHVEVELVNPLTFGDKNYYNCLFFADHIKLIDENPKSKNIKLKIPYKSQVDNLYKPTGTCNITSVAMCLEFLKAERKRNDVNQFEDELFLRTDDLGLDRHSPVGLAQLIVDYKKKDEFIANSTIEAVQQHLESGFPCITHGYFTTSGHIVVLVGYDENGFIVHDPWGEWFSWGYNRNDETNNEKGKYIHYSYDLIRETCMYDGEFWVHFVSHQ